MSGSNRYIEIPSAPSRPNYFADMFFDEWKDKVVMIRATMVSHIYYNGSWYEETITNPHILHGCVLDWIKDYSREGFDYFTEEKKKLVDKGFEKSNWRKLCKKSQLFDNIGGKVNRDVFASAVVRVLKRKFVRDIDHFDIEKYVLPVK